MNRIYKKISPPSLTIIVLLIFCNECWANFQYDTKKLTVLELGDTSAFSPNQKDGWHLENSFLERRGDSIELEVILNRNISGSNNWTVESQVGTISSSFVPVSERTFFYNEPNRNWLIRIQTDGRCFIKLLGGPMPSGNPVELPIQTKYKG